MDPLNLTLTRTTSRPATDHPINHTPRPSRAPMTKDPFLLQSIPNPPSPTKSRIADIFHRRRQASRQQQSQTFPHPPTSMPAPLADDNNAAIEMRTLTHHDDRAKKTDSTSTSMGTPKSPAYPPGTVAPLPVAPAAAAAAPPPATNNKNSARQHRSAPNTNTEPAARGSLLEGVRYSLPGGEPVGWFEMFEKTRKFEGGFVETAGGQIRCIHPSAWGEDELGEYGPGGGEQGQVVRSPGGMGGRGKGGGGRVSNVGGGGGRVVGDGDGDADAVGEGASGAPAAEQGGIMERADSETLGNARFDGESGGPAEMLGGGRFGESIVPTISRSAALRGGLIGLGDEGEDGDDEGEGGPSSGRSHEMEIKVVLDEGPKPGMVIGGGRVV